MVASLAVLWYYRQQHCCACPCLAQWACRASMQAQRLRSQRPQQPPAVLPASALVTAGLLLQHLRMQLQQFQHHTLALASHRCTQTSMLSLAVTSTASGTCCSSACSRLWTGPDRPQCSSDHDLAGLEQPPGTCRHTACSGCSPGRPPVAALCLQPTCYSHSYSYSHSVAGKPQCGRDSHSHSVAGTAQAVLRIAALLVRCVGLGRTCP